MGASTETNIGLYYPFIQFRSDSWLKLATLYWDKVARIVPPKYQLEDSDTVLRLQAAGLIDNLPPSYGAMESVGAGFQQLIRTHGDLLEERYGVRDGQLAYPADPLSQTWPTTSPQTWSQPLDPSWIPGTNPELAYIYADSKMTPELFAELVSARLGVPIKGHGLIGLHPQLAFVYMQLLADSMGSSLMRPLTDDDFNHLVSGYGPERLAETLLGKAPQPQEQKLDPDQLAVDFAMIAMRSLVPKDIDAIPVEKIVKLRREHGEELVAFQSAIRRLISEVPGVVASVGSAVRDSYLANLYDRTLKLHLTVLKKRLDEHKIDTVFGAFNLKVATPQLAVTGTALFGAGATHLNPLLMGSGALVLCFVPYARKQHKAAEETIRASEAAYLFRLEKELQPSGLMSNLARHAGRFLPFSRN